MVKIEVIREDYLDDRTLGKMYVNGEYFCDTLEDTDRALESGGTKIYGETAIPKGTYRVTMYYWSKYHNHYPLLLRVPQYTGIFIHGGTNPKSTLGCIIIGTRSSSNTILNSKTYVELLRDYFKLDNGKWDTGEITVK